MLDLLPNLDPVVPLDHPLERSLQAQNVRACKVGAQVFSQAPLPPGCTAPDPPRRSRAAAIIVQRLFHSCTEIGRDDDPGQSSSPLPKSVAPLMVLEMPGPLSAASMPLASALGKWKAVWHGHIQASQSSQRQGEHKLDTKALTRVGPTGKARCARLLETRNGLRERQNSTFLLSPGAADVTPDVTPIWSG
jgi:hypothetical protein